ncbi:J domain-containing protein [Vibrio sp. SCSIO 43135]|uniref:tetratricopeptide repeat protein n=1 Tax=Vibrio sp. SCSIO 43135 TaxID=2819096 RepID=UPI00207663C9|nr:J domain-containing protein [Vibrio sp. SCSIO 43135]USD42267.1 J domain-containing protein [Vibrio sp. SCSIO 43135]
MAAKLVLILTLLIPFFTNASTIEELTVRAEQKDASAQYQLAKLLNTEQATQEQQDTAFYWYQQAAENGHREAKFALANILLKGQITNQNVTQALYWLTGLAVSGDVQAQIALGTVYESMSYTPKPLDMAEVWYHVAAQHDAKGEDAYGRILERKFNERKAKQVSSLDQLDIAFDEPTQTHTSTTPPLETGNTNSSYLTVILTLIFVVASFVLFKRAQSKKKLSHVQNQQKQTETIEQQKGIIKQQKRQLETLFRQLKKLQSQPPKQPATDQRVALACAMFGFKQNQIPDAKQIKLRFKKLSKIYHPDLGGSDDDMKRLNSALKIILTHVNK